MGTNLIGDNGIVQGDDVPYTFQLLDSDEVPVDVTPLEDFVFTIRTKPQPAGEELLRLSLVDDPGQVEKLTPASDGKVRVVLPAASTALLPCGRYVYDVKTIDWLGDGTGQRTPWRGEIDVIPTVGT